MAICAGELGGANSGSPCSATFADGVILGVTVTSILYFGILVLFVMYRGIFIWDRNPRRQEDRELDITADHPKPHNPHTTHRKPIIPYSSLSGLEFRFGGRLWGFSRETKQPRLGNAISRTRREEGRGFHPGLWLEYAVRPRPVV